MNLWLVVFLWFCVGKYMADDDILVQLSGKQGKIRGHILSSYHGKNYYAFQEIPYATPPIGRNRFKEPKEHKGWEGILNTTVNKKVCMQNSAVAFTPVPDTMEINEDCLYINVYTPVKPGNKSKTLPVLFWIHAGGYFYGSGAYQYYNPKYLIDYDIIVVTMNYRLGPFGFLTTADRVIPQNLGLKDQVFAFQWVIRNIHLFGGDLKSITVAGQSAGAYSAGYVQLNRKLQGHIRGFILESGSPLAPTVFQDDPRHYAFKMGKALNPNFDSEKSKDLLDLLSTASSSAILMANVTNDRYTANLIARMVVWLPSIEIDSNSIVIGRMHESLIRGDFIRVPLLTGFCSEEAKFFVRISLDELRSEASIFDKNISLIMNPHLNVAPQHLKVSGLELRKIYTPATFERDPGAFMKFLSDDTFTTPIIRHSELASGFSRVFLYQFAYQGKMDGLSFLPDVPGADSVAHTAEVKYLFGGLEGALRDARNYPISDQVTMRRMLELWTNFIKYQNPTPKKIELLQNVVWPPVKPGGIQYLNISKTLDVLSNPKFYNKVKNVLINYIKPPLNVF